MGNKQIQSDKSQQIKPEQDSTDDRLQKTKELDEIMDGLDSPEKQQKIALMLIIDEIKDSDTLRSIIKTFILTKSGKAFDNEMSNALQLTDNELLSDKTQRILTLSLFIQCANKNIPSCIANVIAEYAQKRIILKIAHKSAAECKIDVDTMDNDKLYIPPLSQETFVTLNEPQLLGDDATPFQVAFDVTFPNNPNLGRRHCNRHGGIYFGHKNITNARCDGHKMISQGAKCTVIDWNDRYGYNPPDHGFRIYGINEPNKWRFDEWKTVQNPPKQWRIVFKKNNQCEFFANNKKVYSFICVSNSGYIAFWMFQRCGICIENLQVSKI